MGRGAIVEPVVTPPTLPSIIADWHPHTLDCDPPWCDGCEEDWPCATVRLFRECREALEKRSGHRPFCLWEVALCDCGAVVVRALLARLTEEVTP
jgi:hypothetical protein